MLGRVGAFAVLASLLCLVPGARSGDLDDLSSLFGGGGSGECTYTCADGQPSKALEQLEEPSSNGCGTAELPMQEEGERYHLTYCCNEHDKCYTTCGSDFDSCEASFSTCLKDSCAEHFPDAESEDGKQCRQTASLFAMATRIGGCSYFKRSQKDVCDCSEQGGPGSDKKKRRLPGSGRRSKRGSPRRGTKAWKPKRKPFEEL